jgi:hypothetical protein
VSNEYIKKYQFIIKKTKHIFILKQQKQKKINSINYKNQHTFILSILIISKNHTANDDV